MRLQARMLADGQRLHLSDGPIDLIVRAWGSPDAVRDALAAATRRAGTILDELCGELPLLRAAAPTAATRGAVARRMQAAVAPFAARCFITPMAAVAGAVAEAVLAAMVPCGVRRAFVNNGGDIALHLAPGEWLTAALVDRPDRACLFARARIEAASAVRGIATSGWRGRSHSLGIADAVCVLASTAAAADAAATVIANAVDLPGHPAIGRAPASATHPDSDLGERLVTRRVGALSGPEMACALDRGQSVARAVLEAGLATAVAMHLGGATRIVDDANCLLEAADA